MEIPTDAVLLRIFLGESDRWEHKPLYEAIVLAARAAQLAGATVLRGPMGFGKSSHLHTAKILRLSMDLPLVIEIVDSEEKINAFLPMIDEMMESGLVTLERARVLQYGRKRSSYFKRLKESVLQHLHIREKSQPGESGSKAGQVHSSEPPR